MHHRHLRIVLVLLLLATVNTIAGPKDQWFTMGSYVVPIAPQYMVSGGYENGRELFVCRAAVDTVIFPGKTWDGLGGCFVAAYGVETLITPYQVLAKPPLVSDYFVYRWATRTEMITNPGLWYLAVQGGVYSSGDYHVCSRDLWLNGTYVGRHPGRLVSKPPSDWCEVTWGGQVYWAQDWDILLYANE
jgi:hypothetical protein